MNNSSFLYILLPFLSLLIFWESSRLPENESGRNPISAPTQCIDCHSDLIESPNQHKPAAESCGKCHTVDFVAHTENGARGLNLNFEMPFLCLNCHEDTKQSIETVKTPHLALNTEKKCANCHSPHSSDQKALLVSEEKKLCLSCHNKDVTLEGKPAVNIKKLLSVSKVVHPPVEKGCKVCHQPHGSDNNYLLISAFPRTKYLPAVQDSFAFCWECHDSDLLSLEKTTTSTNFRDGDRNLHFVHMNGKRSRSCVMCHNVHAAPNEHLIEDKVKYGKWELPIKYTANEKGGSCFPGCHSAKQYSRPE